MPDSFSCPRVGGGGSFLEKSYRYVPPQRVGVFGPFWSENGYTFCPFWSGMRYVFRGNYGSVWTYVSVQFQMNKNELEIFEFEMHLKKLFVLRSNLRNVNIISA